MTKYVLSIVVDNNPNVMARVSSMFARRRFNMTSVTAAQTSDPNVSVITIVTEGDAHVLDQAIKQTHKLLSTRRTSRSSRTSWKFIAPRLLTLRPAAW